MSDIFISYARGDRARAEQLARVFEQRGWTVWWDRELVAGNVYSQEIAEALSQAKAVIVLWSRASVASNWVKDEAQEGATRGVLIPVLIDAVALPLGFRQIQAADLSDWDGSRETEGLRDLLRGVAHLVNQPGREAAPVIRDDVHAPPRPRPTWLYIVAALLLISALGFAAYQLFGTGEATNNNLGGNSGGGNSGGGNSGGGNSQTAPCSLDARHKAANTTIEGLQLLDPDFKDEMAVIKFKEAIAECAEYADAYYYRGQSYVRLGDPESALEDFKTALKLSLDRNNERQARKFITELEGGHGGGGQNTNAIASGNTPVNTAANTGRNNGNGGTTTTNTTANANNSQNTNSGTSDPATPRVQVSDIFVADKTKRIAATTRLIIEKKQDASAVKQAVAGALAHPDNKSGVINTLVYLENVDPPILKQNRAEIEKLFAAAKENGPQTVEHIKKVQALLGN